MHFFREILPFVKPKTLYKGLVLPADHSMWYQDSICLRRDVVPWVQPDEKLSLRISWAGRGGKVAS